MVVPLMSVNRVILPVLKTVGFELYLINTMNTSVVARSRNISMRGRNGWRGSGL